MSENGYFSCALGPCMASYLALKEALGRCYANERAVLESLDAVLTAAGDCADAADLSAETFGLWCKTQEHLSSGVRRNRMRIVKNFCLYLRRTDPGCFVPDPSLFPKAHQPVQPYIFKEREIRQLLAAACSLESASRSPLRAENFRLAIVLFYTTGLRRGELVRMTVGDFDHQHHTLLVRGSKFHKSRLLPLSADGVREVQKLLQAHHVKKLPVEHETPLLWNGYRGGRAYSGVGLWQGIRALLKSVGIRNAVGQLPRIHDFRHTFAVHALLRWYREGADVQAKLPLLATYMGHVSIVSTEYYLHFIEELAVLASDRFAQSCGALLSLQEE